MLYTIFSLAENRFRSHTGKQDYKQKEVVYERDHASNVTSVKCKYKEISKKVCLTMIR